MRLFQIADARRHDLAALVDLPSGRA